jgi:phosphotransferase system HPr-like phosphotransfer protein
MKSHVIVLKSIVDVKNFVNITNRYDFDIDLESGRYTVDAKSIMGIFSLDLSKPITVHIYAEDENAQRFEEEIMQFK